jgi:hypothetical protein
VKNGFEISFFNLKDQKQKKTMFHHLLEQFEIDSLFLFIFDNHILLTCNFVKGKKLILKQKQGLVVYRSTTKIYNTGSTFLYKNVRMC